MIEVSIDYVKPGDVIAKLHTFKKFDGGMSSTVDLMDGFKLTEKIITKLKNEFSVQTLFIKDETEEYKNLENTSGYNEMSKMKVLSTLIQNMNEMKYTGVINTKTMGVIVEDIISNVHNIIKNGAGGFRTLLSSFTKVQSHDTYTWDHSVNSAIYALVIAMQMPEVFNGNHKQEKKNYINNLYNRQEILVFNMLLHDIGKIKVPSEILNKNGKLSDEELEIVQKHPYFGYLYLKKISEKLKEKKLLPIPSTFRVACLYHHQNFDGSGYPDLKIGIDEVRPFKQREIPIIGRIAAVADIYDALTSKRPYRLPLHPAFAVKVLENEKGKKIDPKLADCFINYITPFPIGTTLQLSTGELAVVIGFSENNKQHPIVKPYLKKIRKNGKKEIIRLFNRNNIKLLPDSRIKIVINKEIYRVNDNRETDTGIVKAANM